MNTVIEIASGHECRIGLLGNIVISVFHGPGRVEQLRLLRRAQDEIVLQHPKVVSVTIIASEKLDTPTSEFRAESAALHARFEHTMICSAVVITTKGLAAIVARSFLAAYQLIVQYKTPQQTFREIGKAVEWIQKTAPETMGIAGAAQAIEAFAVKPSQNVNV